ncbi:MAG: hypothetical protein R2856_28405 [Caldilineaceae bacterium]
MTDRFEVGYALLIGVSENAVPKLALPDVAGRHCRWKRCSCIPNAAPIPRTM